MHRFVLQALLALGILYSSSIYSSDKKILVVGFGINKPPYVLENENSGLEVEIVREAAHVAGYEIKPFFGPLERLKFLLTKGDLDAITITNTNEKLNSYNSLPFISYSNYAIALKMRNLKIKKITDLKQYSIASFQRARDLLGDEFSKMTKENPQYHEYADQKLRNYMLYKNRVDVVVGDKRIFEYFNTQLESTIDHSQPIIFYDLFKVNHYQAAFRSETVMKEFNEGLLKIKQNGLYRKLEIKYSHYNKNRLPSKK